MEAYSVAFNRFAYGLAILIIDIGLMFDADNLVAGPIDCLPEDDVLDLDCQYVMVVWDEDE
jgi:hypothetical protein